MGTSATVISPGSLAPMPKPGKGQGGDSAFLILQSVSLHIGFR